MKYFEKIAISKEEKEIYTKSPYRFVPLAGGYLSSPEKYRKKHPVVATLLGPQGTLGATAKGTGKSQLGTAVKSEAIVNTAIGAAVGGVVGLAGGAKGGALAKKLFYNLPASAAAGAFTGAVAYGAGHLFGNVDKKYKKKK